MVRLAEPSWQLGIYAYETDLVDATELSRALSTWAGRPDRPLVELLIEQGSLSADDVPLLQALWEQQTAVAGHGSPLNETRVAAVGESEDFSSSGNVSFDWDVDACADGMGRLGNRFEIHSTLASGGLGRVSIARDRQLNRQVAVKQIDSRHAQNVVMRQRFLREAEIIAALEHPAIVPIYAVGLQDDGSPFYAMRLLENKTLRDVVDASRQAQQQPGWFSGVEFRNWIGRIIAVCHAVEFAHSRHIVHRDIKPANILVGGHGQTMVVDWGLAKRIDGSQDSAEGDLSAGLDHEADGGGEALTIDGTALGTPAYMSPEHAAGDSLQLGPASDVFCLGATLYYLLTGAPPYRGQSAADTVRLAARAEFARPRLSLPQIPPPLEAICLRAMARRPADRYASAHDLAEDLERWLADQPVTAYREPIAQRLSRLARRHRTVARVTAGALFILAVVASVFSLVLQKQNQVVRSQREAASALASEKSDLAAREHAARLSAGAQGRIATKTLRTVVWNLQRKLAAIPAALEVRRELLSTALEGLSRVETSLADAALVDRDMMVAHNDIGMIYLFAGDAVAGDATSKALAHFSLAREIAQQLVDQQPEDITARRDLSIAWEYLGDVHLERGEWDESEHAFHSALDASRSMVELEPANAAHKRDVAFGWEKVGDVHLKRERIPEARAAFESAHDIYMEIVQSDPENLQAQRDLTVSMQKMGNLFMQELDFAAAAETYQACLDLIQQQIAVGSTAVQPRDRSVLLNKLGEARLRQERFDDAIAAFNSSLSVAREIASAAPDSAQAQRDVAYSLIRLADAQAAAGQANAAREHYEQSLAIRETLAAQDTQNFAGQTELAGALVQLAKLERSAGNAEGSTQLFQRARNVLLALAPEALAQSPTAQALLRETE